MDPQVGAASITAIASIIVSIFSAWKSFKSQESVERLKTELSKQQAEHDAQLDYVYEARKKLYQQCEPLVFQLVEASETALNHIKGLVKRAKAEDGVVFSEQYSLKTNAYHLLLPCVVFRLFTKRLTLVDLQVDDMIYTQYFLAKTVYLSYTDDFQLARQYLELQYNPYVKNWREKREENPRVYRRQGFALGRLDNALDAFINEEKTGHYMSFGQFEKKFDIIKEGDVNSSLGTAKDIFSNFHPHTRPVLWRILVTQALLYRCIVKLSLERNMTSSQIKEFLISISKEEIMADFDWRSANKEVDDNTIYEPFEVAKTYLQEYLQQPLKLLEAISKRKENIETLENSC